MHRALIPFALLLTLACDRPPMPLVEDAARCALTHAVAREQCSPHAADPLADAACADAVRAMLGACTAAPWPALK